MAKRLIKVAKELNVGTTTIVDHLKTKGFDLDNKPTAQVTDEMYAELNNAFQSSIAIKEKADQLVIGTRPSTTKREKDVVKIPPIPNPKAVVAPPPPPSAPKKKEEPAPPVKTNIKESAPKEVPVEAKTATTESNVKVSGKLKILGKIDLDSRKKGKPTAPKVVKPVEKVEAKVEPPKVKEEVVAPKAVVEPPKAAEPKVEAPVVVQKVETPPSVEKTPPVPKVEKETKTPVVDKEPKLQEKAPVVKEEVKDKEAPKVVEAKQEVKKEEPKAPKAKVVKDKTEPAEKAKAPKKDKSERPKPKKGKVEGIREKRGEQAPTDTTESAADAPVGNKMVRAETPELRGLKIVGKIDTDQFKRKRKKKKKDEVKKDKPGIIKDGDAKSEDGDSRRKRRRTRKKITTEGQQQEGGDARGGRSRTSDDRNRTGERSTSRTGGGGGDRSRTGGGDRSRTGGGDRSRTGGGERSTSRTGGGGDRSRTSGGDRSRTGGGDRSRTGGGERTPRSRNANRGRGGARGGSRSGGNRRDEIKEVSQKEIDDKIKATMARISGRGNKKRSRVRRENRERIRDKQELREQEKKTDKLQVTEFISVSELASLMDVAVTDVIMTCMNLGYIVSINQRLDAEIIELVGEDYGHEVEFISVEEHVDEEEEIVDDPADLRPRSPIVTVMGHVDHGKTSLLDYIRDANVADGEAGGITQHIGAYEVRVGEEKKQITFLDTPGHEAFTAMRARGAKVTDIAVIIISADDSIMPQTKEAISHAQAASVPMVFAINKIDKDGAQPERIKQELASMNLLVEEWGGKYQSQDISAKTGLNIDLLLEKIILEAEILELKANPSRAAIGAVLEASLDKGRGYVAKTLVQTGTLKIGDAIVAGEYSGKVKAMFNERGKRVKKAGPSTPVLVLGLGGAPQAGELFKVVDSEQDARSIASKRMQIAREQANRANKRISLDELGRRIALGTFKELNLIVKGDVDGSIEALSDSLIKLSVETVQVNVIHKAVGQIIESDVLLASASDAIIIGFQVRPSLGARKLAEREGVEIKTYSVIYDVIDEVKMAMEGMLEPTKEKKVTGNVEIREVYKISKIGNIAGCYVLDGKISRNSHVSVIRDGIVMYPLKEGVHGELASLKRYKDDIKEVKFGMECGLTVKGFNDIKVGDIVEAYDIVEIKQTLSSQKKR